MKHLFILPQVIYPQSSGGKKIILGRIFEQLTKNSHVAVICFNTNNEDTEEFETFCKYHKIDLYIFTPKYAKKKIGIYRYLDYLRKFFSFYPKFSVNTIENDFIDLINKYYQTDDILYFESIYFYPLLKYIKHNINRSEIHFVFQNVESLFLNEVARLQDNFLLRLVYTIESIKTKYLEKKIFKSTNNLLFTFLTDKDLDTYKQLYAVDESHLLLNKNNLFMESTIKWNPDLKNKYILFAGSISFEPNFEALKWFKENIFTDFLNKHPDVKLIVTGKYEMEKKSIFDDQKILFTGNISQNDLDSLYEKCLFVISPILSGSGIKVKNIEAIKNGIPIVMTHFSSIGVRLNNEINVYSAKDDTKSEFLQECYKAYANITSMNIDTKKDSSNE